jgi:predicted acylesterase/phospholipase RssA
MTEQPTRNCDIVMKGGITSGIVYPTVVCGLAAKYRFKNLGGTSAGALAAALTAAAEYSRHTGKGLGDKAFGELAKIPGWLASDSEFGGGSNLFRLFQPQKGLEGLYRFATGFLLKGVGNRVAAWVRWLWPELIAGLLPLAAFVAILACRADEAWRTAAAVALSIFVLLAGEFFAILIGVLIRVRRFPAMHFGFCVGAARSNPKRPVALVNWLNDTLSRITGKNDTEPLTFGDLADAGIVLKVVTTCLTLGRPFSIPFDHAEERFFFSPAEMLRYFPEPVVQWMEEHPPDGPEAPDMLHGERIDLGGLRPLPEARNLPVIVAARMSMSFPILFCAVPLYAVDFTRRRRNKNEPASNVPGSSIGPDELRRPELVWFSDGGITSNFPIHIFDGPLPKWPTFGLDLDDVRPDRPAPTGREDRIRERVWMPRKNSSGFTQSWTRLSTQPGLGALSAIAPAAVNAARNWMDNLQTSTPGYRDRVVHIYLDDHEGGLNLNMPADVQGALADYGTEAANRIIGHFIEGRDYEGPVTTTWENQRWVRFRSTMALLSEYLGRFGNAYRQSELDDRTFRELIEDEPSYKLTAEQKKKATALANSVAALADEMDGVMAPGQPRPAPSLSIRPEF